MHTANFAIPLETVVSKFYTTHNICTPADLDPIHISQLLGVELFVEPIPSLYYGNGSFLSLTIDSRLSPSQQREEFYHGLVQVICFTDLLNDHPQSHLLPSNQGEFNHLVQVMAIPHHMLVDFDLADPLVGEQISAAFTLPLEFCQKRIDVVQKINRKRELVF